MGVSVGGVVDRRNEFDKQSEFGLKHQTASDVD